MKLKNVALSLVLAAISGVGLANPVYFYTGIINNTTNVTITSVDYTIAGSPGSIAFNLQPGQIFSLASLRIPFVTDHSNNPVPFEITGVHTTQSGDKPVPYTNYGFGCSTMNSTQDTSTTTILNLQTYSVNYIECLKGVGAH